MAESNISIPVEEWNRIQRQVQELGQKYEEALRQYEYVAEPTVPHGSNAISDSSQITITFVHALQEGGYCEICNMIRSHNGNHAIIHIMSDSHGVPHDHA